MEKVVSVREQWRVQENGVFRPPDTPLETMEFLSRSWSLSALQVSKTLASSRATTTTHNLTGTHRTLLRDRRGALRDEAVSVGGVVDGIILEEMEGEVKAAASSSSSSSSAAVAEEGFVVGGGNPFSFASSDTSKLIMDRIMSQSQELSPRTSGRPSHSSGPLNGSLTDSPPLSPSEFDDLKNCRLNTQLSGSHFRASTAGGGVGGGKTVGRWLKDRKEKKKEETRAHNAQAHAAVSVAGVAAAVAAIAAATAAASSSSKDQEMARTDMAIASAATLVAAQCVEAAEAMGAEREHLACVVGSAVNVRSAGEIMTLTAAAATALRGAAALKARALKEVWNVAAVIPLEKGSGGAGSGGSNGSSCSHSGELVPEENFLGICSRELLSKGCELLKRTRNGDLHWKIVSVYINRTNLVILKMKSKHVAGTITKKKKNVVVEVCKNMPAWPGRHLLEGGEHRHYFGLKTLIRGVVEFECMNQREYKMWTEGVSRLLAIAAERSNKH